MFSSKLYTIYMIFWPIIPSLNTETFPRSEGRGQAGKKPGSLAARMPRFAVIFFIDPKGNFRQEKSTKGSSSKSGG